jgi:hypothetical protein
MFTIRQVIIEIYVINMIKRCINIIIEHSHYYIICLLPKTENTPVRLYTRLPYNRIEGFLIGTK